VQQLNPGLENIPLENLIVVTQPGTNITVAFDNREWVMTRTGEIIETPKVEEVMSNVVELA
jgi:hypothetical protein